MIPTIVTLTLALPVILLIRSRRRKVTLADKIQFDRLNYEENKHLLLKQMDQAKTSQQQQALLDAAYAHGRKGIEDAQQEAASALAKLAEMREKLGDSELDTGYWYNRYSDLCEETFKLKQIAENWQESSDNYRQASEKWKECYDKLKATRSIEEWCAAYSSGTKSEGSMTVDFCGEQRQFKGTFTRDSAAWLYHLNDKTRVRIPDENVYSFDFS